MNQRTSVHLIVTYSNEKAFHTQHTHTYQLRSMMLCSMCSTLAAFPDTFHIIYGFSPIQLSPNLMPFYSHQYQLTLIVLCDESTRIIFEYFIKCDFCIFNSRIFHHLHINMHPTLNRAFAILRVRSHNSQVNLIDYTIQSFRPYFD